jgi:hypothetical protein
VGGEEGWVQMFPCTLLSSFNKTAFMENLKTIVEALNKALKFTLGSALME